MDCSVAGADSAVVGAFRAAFSAATMDKGRLFGRSEACEVGRLCHERGDRADGMPIEGDAATLVRLISESNGESFSLVGELDKSISPSIRSEVGLAARCRGLPALSRLGDSRLVPSASDGRMPMRWAVGGGVFAGDDFCGEMDLARSAWPDCQHFHPNNRYCACAGQFQHAAPLAVFEGSKCTVVEGTRPDSTGRSVM